MVCVHNFLFSRNPVSKKGYLDLYGEQDAQWHRKYVVSDSTPYNIAVYRVIQSHGCVWFVFISGIMFQVVKRPYVLLYNSDKEPVSLPVNVACYSELVLHWCAWEAVWNVLKTRSYLLKILQCHILCTVLELLTVFWESTQCKCNNIITHGVC